MLKSVAFTPYTLFGVRNSPTMMGSGVFQLSNIYNWQNHASFHWRLAYWLTLILRVNLQAQHIKQTLPLQVETQNLEEKHYHTNASKNCQNRDAPFHHLREISCTLCFCFRSGVLTSMRSRLRMGRLSVASSRSCHVRRGCSFAANFNFPNENLSTKLCNRLSCVMR